MPTLNSNSILLIHPLGYPVESADRDISRLANIMPPLGLASMAAYLKSQNIVCAIVDCYAHPDSDRLIRDYLQTEKPAFIGLSCTTSSFLDGCRIARLAKKILPDILSVFGGPHVSALKQKVLQNFSEVDVAVVGEGEKTLTDLIQSAAKELGTIQGVAHRTGDGEIEFNGYRNEAIGLDDLPFPAYEMLQGFPAQTPAAYPAVDAPTGAVIAIDRYSGEPTGIIRPNTSTIISITFKRALASSILIFMTINSPSTASGLKISPS